MAITDKSKKEETPNPFAALFSGQGNPLAAIFQLFAALMGGGGLGSLFSGLFGDPKAPAGSDQSKSIFRRGAESVGNTVGQARDRVSQGIGDAYDATKGLARKGASALGNGWDSVLNMIGSRESSNDYNRVYGPGVRRQNLTNMTIDDVLAWQRKYVNEGSPSSAAGKYQIISKTLAGLKSELGLTGKELFNETMQDRMAMQLIRRRGGASFEAGTMTTAQLAKELSKEWASLPKDASNRSYYDGDGLNKSHIAHSAVLAELNGVKATQASVGRTGLGLAAAPAVGNTFARQASAPSASPVAVAAAPVVQPAAAAPQQQPIGWSSRISSMFGDGNDGSNPAAPQVAIGPAYKPPLLTPAISFG